MIISSSYPTTQEKSSLFGDPAITAPKDLANTYKTISEPYSNLQVEQEKLEEQNRSKIFQEIASRRTDFSSIQEAWNNPVAPLSAREERILSKLSIGLILSPFVAGHALAYSFGYLQPILSSFYERMQEPLFPILLLNKTSVPTSKAIKGAFYFEIGLPIAVICALKTLFPTAREGLIGCRNLSHRTYKVLQYLAS